MKLVLSTVFIVAIIMMGSAIGETAGDGSNFFDATSGMQLVFVKGGCFQMGDTFSNGDSDEKPVHEVCVGDFYVGKHEVTQGQWKKVMSSNPSYFKDCGDDCPVENISWIGAQEFIIKLNAQSGKKYRLPTEAEWEYAARSGRKSEKWAGTSNESALGDYAWYSRNAGSKTQVVGRKKPNDLGIYDMTGNVWEWCADLYGEKYYSKSPRDNPKGPSSGSSRVTRGGSWCNGAGNARALHRNFVEPDHRNTFIGFRIVIPRGQ